jgi:hypothetical protein
MGYPEWAYVPDCIQEWGSKDAAPVLLLMRMAPNLTSLRLQVPSTWDMDGLGQDAPDGTFLPKFTFPNLKHLGVVSADPSMWTEDSCRTIIGCLLAATPSLESLELDDCAELDRELILPPQLVSLDLVHSHLIGSDLQHTISKAPKLKRIGFYHPCMWESLYYTADRLLSLSRCQAAKTLETLVFAGELKRDQVPKDLLAQFPDLKVLGIQCGHSASPNGSDLLIDLLKGSHQLSGLLLSGTRQFCEGDMRKFAEAASNLEFPTLRKVKLVPKGVGGGLVNLQYCTEEPIPTLFRGGNVELVLEDDEGADLRSLVEQMERDV